MQLIAGLGKDMLQMYWALRRRYTIPDSLKTAKVVPNYKEGLKTAIANYRPISLLIAFSKIYEKIMHRRIADFVDANNTLYEDQYGFRAGRSCEHALLNAQNTLSRSLGEN